MRRPEYVPQHSRRAGWPVDERSRALERDEQRHERAVGKALIAFTALVVVATVGGLLAAMLFGPDPVRWVWP